MGTLELCFEDGLVDACLGVYPWGAFWVPVAEGGLLSGALVVVFVRFAFGCFVFDPLDAALDVFDPGLVIFRVFQINSVAAVRREGGTGFCGSTHWAL
jgi:hypothetical protein